MEHNRAGLRPRAERPILSEGLIEHAQANNVRPPTHLMQGPFPLLCSLVHVVNSEKLRLRKEASFTELTELSIIHTVDRVEPDPTSISKPRSNVIDHLHGPWSEPATMVESHIPKGRKGPKPPHQNLHEWFVHTATVHLKLSQCFVS